MLSDFQSCIDLLGKLKVLHAQPTSFGVAFDKVIIMIENIYDGNQKHKYCFRQQYYEQQEMLNVSRRTTQRLFFEDTKTHKKRHKFLAETTKIKYMRK